MRIDSSGNVGIGTTSPTPPTAYGGLHINSQYPVLKLSSTTSGTGVADGFTVRINSTDDAQLWHYENKNMSFATNNAERMRIDSTGNVGIGTTSPEALLHVQKNANGAIGIKIENYYGANASAYLYLTTPNVAATGESSAYLSKSNTGGGLTIGNPETDSGSYTRFVQGSSERMRITSSGNVGIGTASPNNYAGYGNITLNGTTGGIFDLSVGNTRTGSFTASASSVTVQSRTAIPLIFETSASEKMRINSNGNIGIGTSNSTTAKVYINHEGDVDDNGLYVYSNIGQTVPLVRVIQDGAGSTAPAVYIRNDDADGIVLHLYKGSSVVTPHTEANSLFIEDSNNAGITIGSGTSKRSSLYFANTTDNDIAKIVVAHDEGTMKFTNNTAERMRIDPSGNVLVNGTSAVGTGKFQAALGVAGFCSTMNSVSNQADYIQFWNGSEVGSIKRSGGSAVVYNTSSDYRLKENVSYDFDATTRLKQLKPARFNFIADGTDKVVDGFIAHEVSSVVPEAISGEKDAVKKDGTPDYQGIDQSKLVPLLVKTIQELEARITALENA
jgi:hypothetical protein